MECNDTVILGFMMAQFIADFHYQVLISRVMPDCRKFGRKTKKGTVYNMINSAFFDGVLFSYNLQCFSAELLFEKLFILLSSETSKISAVFCNLFYILLLRRKLLTLSGRIFRWVQPKSSNELPTVIISYLYWQQAFVKA